MSIQETSFIHYGEPEVGTVAVSRQGGNRVYERMKWRLSNKQKWAFTVKALENDEEKETCKKELCFRLAFVSCCCGRHLRCVRGESTRREQTLTVNLQKRPQVRRKDEERINIKS